MQSKEMDLKTKNKMVKQRCRETKPAENLECIVINEKFEKEVHWFSYYIRIQGC